MYMEQYKRLLYPLYEVHNPAGLKTQTPSQRKVDVVSSENWVGTHEAVRTATGRKIHRPVWSKEQTHTRHWWNGGNSFLKKRLITNERLDSKKRMRNKLNHKAEMTGPRHDLTNGS